MTSKNYIWCDLKTYKVRSSTPPVCTTIQSWYSTNREVTIPGTLRDGKCEISLGSEVHTYTENIKVLGFRSCNNNESISDLKFWF